MREAGIPTADLTVCVTATEIQFVSQHTEHAHTHTVLPISIEWHRSVKDSLGTVQVIETPGGQAGNSRRAAVKVHSN